MRRMHNPWTDLLAAMLLYGVVLAFLGYQYGQGDQSQILPCLYAQDNPGAYAHDHYVQYYLNHGGINERTIFHFLLRFAGYQQPWIVWIWHAIASIALILAWIRIAAIGIHQKVYQYFTVLLMFTIAQYTSTGGNELYYNAFIPSLAAKSLASWGLYLWIREKYWGWVITLAIAGWLQPLVGIQVFLVTGIALLIHWAIKWKSLSLPWKQMLVYLALTLPWFYLLVSNNAGHQDKAMFLEIMEFRLAHHFFPHAFGTLHLVIFGLLAIVSLRFFRQRIRWCILLILLGCAVYTFAVEKYQSPIAMYTQWWKTSIWLEAFSLVALGVGLERLNILPKVLRVLRLTLPLAVVAIMIFLKATGRIGQQPTQMYPWSSKVNPEKEISLMARKLTPENAVFIVPVDLSAFRWYSKRSQYIDYKAMIHQEEFLLDWYDRIQEIYAFSLKDKKAGFSLQGFSNTILNDPSTISIDIWKQLGITHIISRNPGIAFLKKVSENEKYVIYAL